jgi:hypothetical protein
MTTARIRTLAAVEKETGMSSLPRHQSCHADSPGASTAAAQPQHTPTPLTGQDALVALVDAHHLLACFFELQQRVGALQIQLQVARDRAETQAREAVRLIERFAETDPAQLGVSLSGSAQAAIGVATDQLLRLEQDVTDSVVRRCGGE